MKKTASLLLPKGVWPVMLTPFSSNGEIDLSGLESLVDFYIRHNASGLFANCLSSEFFHLSPEDMLLLCKKTVEFAAGRVPVATGLPQHGTREELVSYIKKFADAGAVGTVISTCQIVAEHDSDDLFKTNLEFIMQQTGDVPLGTYECPIPYKRLISKDLFSWLAQTGRFYFHKDTSCNIKQIQEKLSVCKETQLQFFNANLETLVESLRAGGHGYSGVDVNFFPELCVWLCRNYASAPAPKIQEVEMFLGHALDVYNKLYPRSAKLFLNLRGVSISPYCRRPVPDYTPNDLYELEELYHRFLNRKNSEARTTQTAP
ncbi:MAG: dihydrodipicolinate synthase family protein [Kiritimatiellales bacterium]